MLERYILWRMAQLDIILVFGMLSRVALAQDPGKNTWQIALNSTASIGPDGPWWDITRAVYYPDQKLSVFPGLCQTSLIMSSGASRAWCPYLYLPRETCDAIAELLPVTYNDDFNLYLWNTESSAYSDIISSPHSLVFSYASGAGGSQTANINVPFALLNLTLDAPLTSTPTPYFPCSPLTSSADTPYHLGRAAFLGANFHMNKLFLAQAASNAPDWNTTWAGTLKKLTSTSTTTGSGSASATSNSSGDSQTSTNGSPSVQTNDTGISKGALAGIVAAGVLGLVGGAFVIWYFCVYKGRHQKRQQSQQHQTLPPPEYTGPAVWSPKDPLTPSTPELADSPQQCQLRGSHYSEKGYVPVTELHARSRPSELAHHLQLQAAELA
ncbi:uncharacterized protein A1O9_01774 [Exophiala aquamarina CBS 119918]|uniref:Peptidase A1 domain-containing protein n=1 Tax=Exophiala aquamarina CBS 119918 TaxID=1182545 RepID=A0A072PVC4_9EURO|nr:uncharacterized protein A1O9_01774 [Exophiala aquamarina CBS 119918]KEF63796.1 hypothetical protein A1O9_01774 [Exophiala aquamarina CBS 119918]